ncbi:hypothetical protein OEG86_20675 [Hoeflea alexandrii]|uniref:hypothetical protein n=1 Tax=Hoeflea alexandrii TaxID=288436 RepID=UPI00226ED684|nr:hypothetical protein [Hoeflea alexandrii]MCY0154245.1 hypothetical protein [Hoeflea alexandrii]
MMPDPPECDVGHLLGLHSLSTAPDLDLEHIGPIDQLGARTGQLDITGLAGVDRYDAARSVDVLLCVAGIGDLDHHFTPLTPLRRKLTALAKSSADVRMTNRAADPAWRMLFAFEAATIAALRS